MSVQWFWVEVLRKHSFDQFSISAQRPTGIDTVAFHKDNMRSASVHWAEQHTCLSPAPRKRRWQLSALAGTAEVPAKYAKGNWRRRAKPVQEGSTYPAKEHCSHCGLCDTYYVAHVKEACAFLGSGVPSRQHSIAA